MEMGWLWGYRWLLAAVLALASSAAAWAQPADLGQTVALNGTVAGVAACIACHGMKGEGDAIGGFPRIAGLGSDYIEAQLVAYASGQRQSSLMELPAKLLAPAERSAVAAYFSQLQAYSPDRAIVIDESAHPSDVGAWLATRGRWSQNLPACAQCHGATGLGVGATFPPLTGQPASYLALQLHHWKDGTRPAGPMGLMPLVASKLSDSDITAVAAYYGGPNARIQQLSTGARP
jgi:cytochrome c553